MPIHETILKVRRALPAIEKRGDMTLGSNRVEFTRITDIKRALFPLMDEHGLLMYPSFVGQETIIHQAEEALTMGDPSKGIPRDRVGDGRIPNTRVRVVVTYDWRFVDAADGTEVVVTTLGEAMDTNSDKASGKATTAALKRVLMEVFNVIDPDERDIEQDDPDDKNRAATTDRRDRGRQQRDAATGPSRGIGARKPAGAAPAASAITAEQAAAETGADEATGEVPDEPVAPKAAPELDKLDVQKARVRAAVEVLGLQKHEVDAIAAEVTGKPDRAQWIVLPTAVKKLADELEKRVKASFEGQES